MTSTFKKIHINTGDSEPHYANEDMLSAEDDDFAAEAANYGTAADMVAMDSSATAYELLGCNLVFDWDTLGAGAIGCWIVVGGMSGTVGYYGGVSAGSLSTVIYKKYFNTVKMLHQE